MDPQPAAKAAKVDNEDVVEARRLKKEAETAKKNQEGKVNGLRNAYVAAPNDATKKLAYDLENGELARLTADFKDREKALNDLVASTSGGSSSSSGNGPLGPDGPTKTRLEIPLSDADRLQFLLNLAREAPFENRSSEFNPKLQQELLGPCDVEGLKLPIIRGKIDMRMFSTVEDKVSRPAALKLHGLIQAGADSHIVIAVPGSGKTSALFDLARENIVIYMQCTPNGDETLNHGRRISFSDTSFIAMYQAYLSYCDLSNNAGVLWRMGQRLVIIQLIARLLELVRLNMDMGGSASSQTASTWAFLVQQINWSNSSNHKNSFVNHVFSKLEELDLKRARDLFGLLLDHVLTSYYPGKKLVIVVDEMEVGANLSIVGANREQASVNSSNKGILHIVADAWRYLTSMNVKCSIVFAGTGTSYSTATSLMSDLGKPRSEKPILSQRDFPMLNVQDCKKILSLLGTSIPEGELDNIGSVSYPLSAEPPGGIESLTISEVANWFLLGSRYRLFVGGFERIQTIRNEEAHLNDPREILRLSLILSIDDHRIRLVEMLSERMDREANPRSLSPANQAAYLGYLQQIYVGSLLTDGRASFPHEFSPVKAEVDLTQLGIAGSSSYDMIERADQEIPVRQTWSYGIHERFVLAAIRRLFEKPEIKELAKANGFEDAMRRLHAVIQQFGGAIPFKGNLVEHALLTAFVHLKAKKVGDLEFLEAREPCDSWETWKEVPFHAVTMQLMDGSPEAMMRLASRNPPGILYSPDHNNRSDGILMLGKEGNVNLAMVFGVAVYSDKVPVSKVRSQLKSTNLSLAYYTVAGNDVNDEPKRKEWVDLGLHNTCAIRVQVSLPFAAKSGPRTDYPNNPGTRTTRSATKMETALLSEIPPALQDVFVNIDRTNIHLLLGTSEAHEDALDCFYRTLATATNTGPETWPGAFHASSQASTSLLGSKKKKKKKKKT